MKSLLNHGLSSLLGITLLGLGIPATQAQVFSTNGRSGVYVQGNGQGMAGTFDDKGFHGIAVGPDGQVRRIEGNQANPFSMGQTSGISIHSGNGGGAFAAAGRMPATHGGFDPFAFVFGNSSPISAAGVAAVAGPQPNRMLAAAKRAFLNRRYEETVRMTEELADRGVESIDAVQLRGLARFALQDYEAAAADATSVLASEAAWDWATLRETYSDRETYVQQLRALQAAAGQPTATASMHFLLAYHYLMLDHTSDARDQLIRTRQLQPENRLVERLLASLPPSVNAP